MAALAMQPNACYVSRRAMLPTVCLPAGLGDAWGAAPPPSNPRESCIKELGSHLLQVRLAANKTPYGRLEFNKRKALMFIACGYRLVRDAVQFGTTAPSFKLSCSLRNVILCNQTIEAARGSETSVHFHLTARRHTASVRSSQSCQI